MHPAARERLCAKRLCCSAGDLVGWDIAHVLCEPPPVAEGIGDLPMAVSPERIPEWVQHFGTCSHGAFPEGVNVLDVKVQNGRCAAQALWREDAHLRELISHHQRRVAEPELDAHELPPRQGYAVTLLSTQSFRVPLGGACRVPNDDVGSDGVHSFGDSIHSLFGHRGPPPWVVWVGEVFSSHGRMTDLPVLPRIGYLSGLAEKTYIWTVLDSYERTGPPTKRFSADV